MSTQTLHSLLHRSTDGFVVARRLVLAVVASLLMFYATAHFIAPGSFSADASASTPVESVTTPTSSSTPATPSPDTCG